MKQQLLLTLLVLLNLLTAEAAIDFTVGTPYTSPVRSTCGAGNDCGLRTTEDHEYAVTITTAGSYTFDLCGSSYDTYLYIGSSLCASDIGLNDDFCGLQSTVTATLAVGTYYVTVEGFSGCGNYVLNISGPPTPPTPACYSQLPVPYSPMPMTGTAVSLTDDVHSGVVPIGFNFCYYGTTYSQAVISSNNYLSFDLTYAGAYSPWSTVAVPTATPAEVQNSILGPWQDINPGSGGSIYYQTIGTAPNRMFVVSYLNVPMFSCTGLLYTSQIILREGSNCIETHIVTKPICTTWNSGNAVHGIQDPTGTIANVVAGRNNTAWAIASEGMLWTPSCGTCMTATSPTCASVLLPVELSAFSGENQGRSNVLHWTTTTEFENDYFTIERSIDGQQFAALGQVEGAGSTEETHNYSFEDDAPFSGINYYRLKQTDFDGNFVYSDLISVESSNQNKLMVYPVPSDDFISISLNEKPLQGTRAIIRNAMGQIVLELELKEKSEIVSISEFTSGVYYVEVMFDGNRLFRKFVRK